jgi:hypothetical protein
MERNVNQDVNVKMEDIVTRQQVIAHAHQDSMVITVRKHDLHLPKQSVPITTVVVSSNFDQGELYNIMR